MVMEFDFDVNSLFPQAITRTVGGQLPTCRHLSSDVVKERLAMVVNDMGLASAKAQGLRAPITSYQRLAYSNQTLYVMKEGSSGNGKGVIVGILKTGLKNLFLNDPVGVQHEVSPLCVLDFYVHESRQRCGYGKVLFEAMLKAENLSPFEVAIDRPSPKFLGFLRKHYKLQSYVRQANNYVVFDQFFTTCTDISHKSRRSLLQKNYTTASLLNDTSNPSLEKTTEPFTSPDNKIQPALCQAPPRDKNETSNVKETIFGDTVSPNATLNSPMNDKDACSPNKAIATPKTTIMDGSSTTYNNSVDDVTVMSSSVNVLKPHPQPARKTRFDIITGRPLQHGSDFNRGTNLQTASTIHSPSTKTTKDALSSYYSTSTDSVDSNDSLQKAPYLNMRQSNRNRLPNKSSSSGVSHGLSTYRSAFQASAPGFYSSSSSSMLGSMGAAVMPSVTTFSRGGSSTWDSNMAAARYSKHALPQSTRSSKSAPQSSFVLPTVGSKSGNPLLGTKWNSPSGGNMSTNKLKDKWKTFIL